MIYLSRNGSFAPEKWHRSLIRTENSDRSLCQDGHDRGGLNERIYFHHRSLRVMIIIKTAPRTGINIVAGVSSSPLHCLQVFFLLFKNQLLLKSLCNVSEQTTHYTKKLETTVI